MDYLVVPQRTASWLLAKSDLVPPLASDIASLAVDDALSKGVVALGPIRLSASTDRRILAIWNTDYLSGTGGEAWGAIRLTGQYGLLQQPEIVREVLHFGLQIIDRRLQGLLLDASWNVRRNLPGVTTCIAGRGAAWDSYRIGYVEGEGDTEHSVVRGVLITGPAWEDAAFRSATQRELAALRRILPEANELLTEATQRPTLEYRSLEISGLLSAKPHLATDVPEGTPVSIPDFEAPTADRIYKTIGWTYDDWMSNPARLTNTQRLVLESGIIEQQPVRLIGAAGSGKTLLMMLLSIRLLRQGQEQGERKRVLYIAHNSSMRDKVRARFGELAADDLLAADGPQRLEVQTLFDYAQSVLGVPDLLLLDKDAEGSKQYQKAVIKSALERTFGNHRDDVDASALFSQVSHEPELMDLFAALVSDEIAIAIKGQGMVAASSEGRQYAESERRLSRLHGLMTVRERELIWETFLSYQEEIGVELGLLDADDLALSLLGRLKTPLWELRRREHGYDFVFVDEAQLFDENEKRLFPLLTKRKPYVPIALALDQAQQTRGLATAGLGVLGVEDVSNQTLNAVHRCSPNILRLAFHVIQHTTDLFGPDFPNFTSDTTARTSDGDDKDPTVARFARQSGVAGAADVVRELRQRNRRQIAVVCFSDRYWNSLRDELSQLRLALRVMEGRGESLPPKTPLVALARADAIGGQEFDAVVCVGLEQGVVPLKIHANEALSAALEQQALREMYLAFTRARRELVIAVGRGATLTGILQDAAQRGFLALEERE